MKQNEFRIEDVDTWLKTKHCTMWGGEGWTITSEDTRRKAAEWFVGQINEYKMHIKDRKK